ncbi:MAG: cell division protein ZapA [Proteobacteria bacterium]|nr:cell division protein ZapA [Pseudomonadota bacterium]
MKAVEVSFQNSRFTFHCDDPKKLTELAAKVDALANEVAGGQKGRFDSKILLLTAIYLQEQLDAVSNDAGSLAKEHTHEVEELNSSLIKTIDKVATYIENLAAHLEKV